MKKLYIILVYVSFCFSSLLDAKDGASWFDVGYQPTTEKVEIYREKPKTNQVAMLLLSTLLETRASFAFFMGHYPSSAENFYDATMCNVRWSENGRYVHLFGNNSEHVTNWIFCLTLSAIQIYHLVSLVNRFETAIPLYTKTDLLGGFIPLINFFLILNYISGSEISMDQYPLGIYPHAFFSATYLINAFLLIGFFDRLKEKFRWHSMHDE